MKNTKDTAEAKKIKTRLCEIHYCIQYERERAGKKLRLQTYDYKFKLLLLEYFMYLISLNLMEESLKDPLINQCLTPEPEDRYLGLVMAENLFDKKKKLCLK